MFMKSIVTEFICCLTNSCSISGSLPRSTILISTTSSSCTTSSSGGMDSRFMGGKWCSAQDSHSPKALSTTRWRSSRELCRSQTSRFWSKPPLQFGSTTSPRSSAETTSSTRERKLLLWKISLSVVSLSCQDCLSMKGRKHWSTFPYDDNILPVTTSRIFDFKNLLLMKFKHFTREMSPIIYYQSRSGLERMFGKWEGLGKNEGDYNFWWLKF